jgi:hypothetical protein
MTGPTSANAVFGRLQTVSAEQQREPHPGDRGELIRR